MVSSEECSDYLGARKVLASGEGIGGCGVCPGLLPWGFGCLGLPGVGMGAGLMPPVFGRPAGIMVGSPLLFGFWLCPPVSSHLGYSGYAGGGVDCCWVWLEVSLSKGGLVLFLFEE